MFYFICLLVKFLMKYEFSFSEECSLQVIVNSLLAIVIPLWITVLRILFFGSLIAFLWPWMDSVDRNQLSGKCLTLDY